MRVPFRLLDVASPDRTDTVELLGRRWATREYPEPPRADGKAMYTCVSYAWGAGRIAHPFDPSLAISERTFRVAEAALRAFDDRPLWLDGLCVPQSEPERSLCLRTVGSIYANARVVVVLSNAGAAMLERISGPGALDEDDLLAFESDPWITRLWTYQEVVNCGALFFVAEGSNAPPVKGYDLCHSFAARYPELKAKRSYDMYDLRARHPRLDAIEDLLGDYMNSEFLERTAYRALGDIARRAADEADDDRYYALLGALAPAPSVAHAATPSLPASEEFLRTCEARDDFSFIYSTARRSTEPGRSWRPTDGEIIRPIFPWHTSKDTQTGRLWPTCLQLEGLAPLERGPLDDKSRELVLKWHGEGRRGAARPLHEVVLDCLRIAGFSGCGVSLDCRLGYVFPQLLEADFAEIEFWVSTTLAFVQGAPALALKRLRDGSYRCLGAALFIGQMPKPDQVCSIQIC